MSEHKCGFVYCFRSDTVFVGELQMWRCPDHRKSDGVERPKRVVTTDDVERAAQWGWDEAVEAAVTEMNRHTAERCECSDTAFCLRNGRDAIRALKRVP